MNEETKKLFETILKVYKPGNVGDVEQFIPYLESLNSWELNGIASKPGGHKIDHPDDMPSFIEEEWVNQYENGGYSGDSYAGFSYLKLAEDAWLVFHYSM